MTENIVLKILSVALLSSFVKSNERYNKTTETMNYLFDEGRYDKRLRPGVHEKLVTVTVGLTIVQFGQIREKDMDFSLDIFFYQKWYDKRLTHSLPHPINISGANKDLVWMPDTYFLNIKTAKAHTVPSDIAKLSIFSDGLIRFSTRLTLTAGCEMNLLDYPLDMQDCNLTVVSYSYPIEDLDYIWMETAEKIEILNKAMNEFYLKRITLTKESFEYTLGNWTHLNIMFTFQRRIGYAMLQVYAPTLLIVTLSWLSFWISRDAAPARIGLGITTVLTIVTLMGSLRSDFPKVSYIKAIDLFFIISFLFVFGAVMEYIVVLLKCAMKEKEEKDQEEQHHQSLAAQKINKVYVQSVTSLDYQTRGIENTIQENMDISQDCLDKSSSKHDETRQRKKVSQKTFMKTRNVLRFLLIEQDADVVDRVSRVAFPLCYLLFNIIYWLYYSLGTFH